MAGRKEAEETGCQKSEDASWHFLEVCSTKEVSNELGEEFNKKKNRRE